MTDLTQIHRHHIVPKYKCEELGIDPDFDDNIVDITRKQHAEIHWGYKCNDLSPLLEVCNPPQYILDMIPLGDNRDSGAAALIALGEVDGIVLSGKDHPRYKHGLCVGGNSPAYYRQYQKKYLSKPENLKKHKQHQNAWYEKNKEEIIARQRKRKQQNKLEKATTLDKFF